MVSTIEIMVEEPEVLAAYQDLISSCSGLTDSSLEEIDRAFQIAYEAHKGIKRKSGVPYILHPIAVAKIVNTEIGLGKTSIIAALLHDVVEDTPITLDEIEKHCGKTIRQIVDGLTKITGLFKGKVSKSAENFKKLLLTLGEDIRVVLIKLADRLHNMRTMGAMPPKKQKRIGDETLYLFTPIAHRLGLYKVKSELEDLSMKYADREFYNQIKEHLQATKKDRQEYIDTFIEPVKAKLIESGLAEDDFNIFGRAKHIYSIANKIRTKKVPFHEIFDLFAIRIVFKNQATRRAEKARCWHIFAVIEDCYILNEKRIRNWISAPKANGYESLHMTVMGPKGKWVEVQIRSERMDLVAEKGIAAHWKYKGDKSVSKFDDWLTQIRDILKNPDDDNPIDFINTVRRDLYVNEISVFTPKGDVVNLPASASVLDFAFAIHSEVGERCVGAKIDGKLRPISHKLETGNQIEIITSKNQHPSKEWLNYAMTARARTRIKQFLRRNQSRQRVEQGKEILTRKLRKVKLTQNLLNSLTSFFRYKDSGLFLQDIADEKFDLTRLKNLSFNNDEVKAIKDKTDDKTPIAIKDGKYELTNTAESPKAEVSIFGGYADQIDYSIAPCCNPIAGDDVFGFITIGRGTRIHRVDCPNAKDLQKNYPYRVLNIKWTKQSKDVLFLANISISGLDDIGLVNRITNIISQDLKINIRSISLTATDGIFEGQLNIYVKNSSQLNALTKRLKALEGIYSIKRLV